MFLDALAKKKQIKNQLRIKEIIGKKTRSAAVRLKADEFNA